MHCRFCPKKKNHLRADNPKAVHLCSIPIVSCLSTQSVDLCQLRCLLGWQSCYRGGRRRQNTSCPLDRCWFQEIHLSTSHKCLLHCSKNVFQSLADPNKEEGETNACSFHTMDDAITNLLQGFLKIPFVASLRYSHPLLPAPSILRRPAPCKTSTFLK